MNGCSRWPWFLLVFAAAFFTFLPDLRNGLLDWDDAGYIIENSFIHSLSFDTIRRAFTEFHCSYWAPLTWLSLAIDYAVWGLNPLGYHLTNNLLHAANTGLFFLLAVDMLGGYSRRHPDSFLSAPYTAVFCATAAALLFGVHPMRVESVAWVAERKDVLSVFFGLGALLAYLKYAGESSGRECGGSLFRSSGVKFYGVMVFCYSLSLMSKATLITFPFALLILDWFPLGRLKRERILLLLAEKIPLLFLAVSASLVTMQAMAVSSKSLAEIDLTTRILVAFRAIATYLRLTIMPADISPVYFHPNRLSPGLDSGAAILLVLAITIICLRYTEKLPVLLATWSVFLITVFPVLGLTQNGPQELAPRFTYVPGMALSLLAGVGVMALCYGNIAGGAAKKMICLTAVVVLCVGYAAVTVRDIRFWKDDISLWSRVIELQPHVFGRAYIQRAIILFRTGEYRRALVDTNEGLAIAMKKNYGAIHEIYALRARIRGGMNDSQNSINDYATAIELSKEPFKSRYSLELQKVVQGFSASRQNRLE